MPTRRSVITAGALAPVTLAGCTILGDDPEAEPGRTPTARPPGQPPGQPADRTDPDLVVVAAARDAVTQLVTLADSIIVERPRRARALAGLRRVHEEHLSFLHDLETASGPSPGLSSDPSSRLSGGTTATVLPFPGDDAAARLALTRAEDSLCATLRAAAVSATSGALARILASMSAAAGQQAAVLRRSR